MQPNGSHITTTTNGYIVDQLVESGDVSESDLPPELRDPMATDDDGKRLYSDGELEDSYQDFLSSHVPEIRDYHGKVSDKYDADLNVYAASQEELEDFIEHGTLPGPG